MLSVALTCPLWWVARWTARMLASLAVVVACSFGAATLPVGAATAAHAGPARAVAEPGGQLDGASPAVTGSAVLHTTPFVGARDGRSGSDLVAGTDQQAQPVGSGFPLVALRIEVVAVSGEHAPGGTVPAALGSRAPPTR